MDMVPNPYSSGKAALYELINETKLTKVLGLSLPGILANGVSPVGVHGLNP
jgi:hypothetical protein